MSNSAFSPTVLTIPGTGTSSSGQGELNLITNPVAASNLDGWVGAGRGTSGGPLNPSIDTYFTVLNSVPGVPPYESSTSGAYDVISLPSGLQNKKLKVEFYFTSPAADTFNVSVYKGTTRVPLTTDVGGSTSLPKSTTGKFVAYFDTDSSGTWTVSITRTAGTGGTPLQFTNVVVGPGIQPQGAVVGEWTSYTPTFTGFGTVTTSAFQWCRIGSSILLRGTFTSGSSTAVEARLSLPPGLTIGGTSTGVNGRIVVGQAFRNVSYTVDEQITLLATAGEASLAFGLKLDSVSGNPLGTQTGSSIVSATNVISIDTLEIPIAEWAGSGTVQLAQNDVEYAWNTSTSTTTGDTTSFGYGPGGALIQNISAVGGLDRTVQFQTPIQSSDIITIEMLPSGAGASWVPVGKFGGVDFSIGAQTTTTYGITLFVTNTSNNQVTVRFGQYSWNNSTYGAAGTTWATSGGNYRWRVRKSSAGAAVGFGIVQPGVSSGLVSASGLPGNTTGNVVASGYVGEVVPFTGRSVAGGAAAWAVNSTALITVATTGVYLICGQTSAGLTTVPQALGISTSTTPGAGIISQCNVTPNTSLNVVVSMPLVAQPITAGTSLYMQCYNASGTATGAVTGFLVRIA